SADLNALANVNALEAVTPALFHVPGANVYLPAVSSRVLDLVDGPAWATSRGRLFGLRWLVISPELASEYAGPAGEVVDRQPAFGYLLLERSDALPRVYLAGAECAADATESNRRLHAMDFDPTEV